MSFSSLQRFTVRLSQRVRSAADSLGERLAGSPELRSWFYAPESGDSVEPAEPDESTAEQYRKYNEDLFADLHEQERMIADKPRMAFYHEAIRRHIKPGHRVVDLGTGTGILAAFASRQGAAQVYAVDHSSIIQHAMMLGAENGIENVDFEDVHSSQLYLEEKVDVILHEQMGDFLFDEAMVPNVCDLRDRLLKPGGLILPSQFEFYCEPMTIHDNRRVPYMWELTDVHGFDFSSMERSRPETLDYYSMASCDQGMVKQFLGEPEPAMEIDLHTITEELLPSSVTFSRTVDKAGLMDGLVIYMKARVDQDLVLSSSPLDDDRAPHWGFRILRLDQRHVEVGDELEITLDVADWTNPDTWSWRCEKLAD